MSKSRNLYWYSWALLRSLRPLEENGCSTKNTIEMKKKLKWIARPDRLAEQKNETPIRKIGIKDATYSRKEEELIAYHPHTPKGNRHPITCFTCETHLCDSSVPLTRTHTHIHPSSLHSMITGFILRKSWVNIERSVIWYWSRI